MSARRYEVSFRAGPLDDRQVDALADTLFELGFDDLCFRPLPEPVTREEYEESDRRVREHYGRADSTADRDALRAALQHETARELKW